MKLLHSIDYGGVKISYSIDRRKRKSVGISVSLDKGVKVAAPRWVNEGQIRQIVSEKADWICQKLRQLEERKALTLQIEYSEGEMLPYLGRKFPIRIIQAPVKRAGPVVFDGTCFEVRIPEGLTVAGQKEKVKDKLEKWYIAAAEKYLNQRVDHYSQLLKVKPSKITVRGQKARWGSCNSKGNISLNWKMMMTPMAVIDYIIVHELGHLVHLNHSKKFWAFVEKYLPDYSVYRKWVRLHNEYLKF